MKRLFFTAICLVIPTIGTFAQTTETFDIATFEAPKGWNRKGGADSIQFSIADKDYYSIVTLFRSLPALGKPKENFDAAWATIVKEAVTVLSAPQMLPPDDNGEWRITSGFASFQKDGIKGIALLITATGDGKMMHALVLTNTQVFEAATTAFLNSFNFKKQEPPQQPQVRSDPSGPTLTDNYWKKTQNRTGLVGYAGDYAGYASNMYQFYTNGTYKFTRVDFQYAAPKWYLENEEGTYTVNGNTITVTPKKSVYSSHRLKREDPPLKSGNLALSTVRYNFEFWKHDDNWALLLSPADGKETKRDGSFSFYRNGEPQPTYQYQLVNAKGELVR
jgi:hypothetical protein